MDADDNLPRRRSDTVAQVAREDIDPLSVDELHERVEALRAEIARVEAKIATSTSHRSSADALFRRQ